MKPTTIIDRQNSTLRWFVPGLIAMLMIIGCASNGQEGSASAGRVFAGVPDPKMQQVWQKAEAAGTLPSMEGIPVPKQFITDREQIVVAELEPQKRRPFFAEGTSAGVKPFSVKPVRFYEGDFQVTRHTPGLIVGTLSQRGEQYEIHYKIPDAQRKIAIAEQTDMKLSLRDEVVGSALQRRIVLRKADGTPSFVYIAEGSDSPFTKTLMQAGLRIEQAGKSVNPPVQVTYRGQSVTLEPGQRKQVGQGASAVEIYLLWSVAISPQQAMLQEGQPYYVNIMIYNVK